MVRNNNMHLLQSLLAVGLCAVAMWCKAAYPDRPIRLVVPVAPGGAVDVVGRIMAQKMGAALGQNLVVDNRPGANYIIGTEVVSKAPADGYTLLTTAGGHTINPVVYKKLPYDTFRDFTPISQMTAAGLLLVVNPSHPAKTAKDFVQWTKTTKEPINFGSAGIGSGGHLAGELYNLMVGIKSQHIPYKGTGPAAVGLISGEYHYNFMGLAGAFTHVRSGKLRGIAVSNAKRLANAPEIPAMNEVLPGFEVVGWYGVAAPAKLPKPILTKIHTEIANYVKSPEFAKIADANGSEPVTNSPEVFRQFMLDDMKKWADVVKRSGAKF